jgi:hypothetical protein
MATAKKKVANSKVVAKKAPAKTAKKAPVVAQTTSTSVVSANTVVAKTYEEKRLDEVRPYAEKAVEISGKFDSVTKKIAAFETEMLYKYLGQTFELYKQIEADKKNKDFFYDNLRWHLKENGIKTNKNTSEISLLIRLIFKVKPKTAHLYSRAIEAAYQAKVKPAAFIEYVEAEGGLEKLRISQVEKEKAEQYRSSLKKANDLAWRYLRAMEAKPLAITEIPLKNTHVTPNHFVIMVGIGFGQPGNPNQNAEVRVLSCLPSAKDTEDFVISSIAKNFATNLVQAEKFIEGLEGKVVKALE